MRYEIVIIWVIFLCSLVLFVVDVIVNKFIVIIMWMYKLIIDKVRKENYYYFLKGIYIVIFFLSWFFWIVKLNFVGLLVC